MKSPLSNSFAAHFRYSVGSYATQSCGPGGARALRALKHEVCTCATPKRKAGQIRPLSRTAEYRICLGQGKRLRRRTQRCLERRASDTGEQKEAR